MMFDSKFEIKTCIFYGNMDIIEKRAVVMTGSLTEIINEYQKPLLGRQTYGVVFALFETCYSKH